MSDAKYTHEIWKRFDILRRNALFLGMNDYSFIEVGVFAKKI